jgi:hypothetical protein
MLFHPELTRPIEYQATEAGACIDSSLQMRYMIPSTLSSLDVDEMIWLKEAEIRFAIIEPSQMTKRS